MMHSGRISLRLDARTVVPVRDADHPYRDHWYVDQAALAGESYESLEGQPNS